MASILQQPLAEGSLGAPELFLGNPTMVSAKGRVRPDGREEEITIALDYASGARAHLVISGITLFRGSQRVRFHKSFRSVSPSGRFDPR
jgi:hypothetical protein